ncbi:MAG: hypothetical protein PUD39_03735 [Bacteroidales bacterium]|nr:hypothetical protein [Bacteroidales bacterium]
MKQTIIAIAMMALIVTGCGRRNAPEASHAEKNGVYYWKTVLKLDSADLDFLKRHDVGKVYLRMFDVAEDTYGVIPEEKACPVASVRIDYDGYNLLQDSLYWKEFVPVVYITIDGLKAMAGNEGILAKNIVTRVRNMCEYNGLPNVEELQLDCDWTPSTEMSFFNLCDSVKANIVSLGLLWRLSSTIRLHQLAREAPPVDCGVLMVYNTGNFKDPDANNSIIDAADVEPYLKHLPSYPLHLDVAYPTYSWQLLFSDRKFAGLTNGLNLTDTTRFVCRKPDLYVAKKDIPYNQTIIHAGDMVRRENSAYGDIAKVKEMIEKRLTGREHSNILYHLDNTNLSKYTPDEIDNLYSTGR